MTSNTELVDHFKVDAQVTPTYTLHEKIIWDPAEGVRGSVKKEFWRSVRPVGNGSYGQVILQQGDGSQLRAVKTIPRRRHGEPKDLDLSRELLAMASFAKDNPYFVRLRCWFETSLHVHIAMEYFEHGDLQQCVLNALPEAEACSITRQIVEGLRDLHSKSFTHRDIKPSNIFVASKGPNWWVKIGDFGISKRVHDGETALRTMMTGDYVAPESIAPDLWAMLYGDDDADQDYTNAVDIWSLGCVAYWLLVFASPFPNATGLFQYCSAKTGFPTAALQSANVSSECISFLQKVMAPLPWERLTADQALSARWLSPSGTIPISVKTPAPPPSILASLKLPRSQAPSQATSFENDRLRLSLFSQYQALQEQEDKLRAQLYTTQSYKGYPSSSLYKPPPPYMPYRGYSPYSYPFPYSDLSPSPPRPLYSNLSPYLARPLYSNPSQYSSLTQNSTHSQDQSHLPKTTPASGFQLPQRRSASIVIKAPDGRLLSIPKTTNVVSASGQNVMAMPTSRQESDSGRLKPEVPIPEELRKITEERKERAKEFKRFSKAIRSKIPQSSATSHTVTGEASAHVTKEDPEVPRALSRSGSVVTVKFGSTPNASILHDNGQHLHMPSSSISSDPKTLSQSIDSDQVLAFLFEEPDLPTRFLSHRSSIDLSERAGDNPAIPVNLSTHGGPPAYVKLPPPPVHVKLPPCTAAAPPGTNKPMSYASAVRFQPPTMAGSK
ncbi:hypothetical protein MMC15_004590 [Xylographa vitiligo]|nr:hypothetical protein [Xylographa vitiligo]